MTAVVLTLSIVVAVLAVLVVGLLRSHAEILRRLHELAEGAPGVGAPERGAGREHLPLATGRPSTPGAPTTADTGAATPPRTTIAGTTLTGDPVAVRTDHRDHDTVLLFLSSGCATCAAYWEALADPSAMDLPPDARVVVVTEDLDAESPAALARLTPSDVTLVASSAAWRDFAVQGSPYVVHTAAGTGHVRGAGTAPTWAQVARLLAEATGDTAYLGRTSGRRRPRSDRSREQRADRALLTAGILPGDDRLYRRPAEDADDRLRP